MKNVELIHIFFAIQFMKGPDCFKAKDEIFEVRGIYNGK